MGRSTHKLTVVELMIILAILGIMASILVPAFVKSARRAGAQVDTTAARPAPGKGEGIENTIDVPETQREPSPESTERRAPSSGWLVSVLVWGIIIFVVGRFIRRLKSGLLKGGVFRGPPHA